MFNFNELPSVQFQVKLKPAALKIYQSIFPDCTLEDLRENGVGVHPLDKEFGIDSKINCPSGQFFTIQEKYRKNKFLKEDRLKTFAPCPDFTQEYMNAVGTQYEAPGEYFKLAAQWYFYGWANKQEEGFEEWLMLNIPKYKALIESKGGLNEIGVLHKNKNGGASFYAISIKDLQSVFFKTSDGLKSYIERYEEKIKT